MSIQARHFYEFDSFRLDPEEQVLLRDGKPLPLSPKLFETLLALVRDSGHIVEKEELIKQVWPDTFVEENNLSQYISVLRRTLGEGEERRYIETVPRRGYRFAAGVREVWDENEELVRATHTKVSLAIREETEEQEDSETRRPGETETRRHGDTETRGCEKTVSVAASPRPRVPASLALAALVLAVSMGAAAYWGVSTGNTGGRRVEPPLIIRSVAVLPFSPVGGSEAEKFLGVGMADAVIGRLSRIEQIVVRPTSAVHKYANIPPANLSETGSWSSGVASYDIVVAGQALDVDLVLHGTVERAGERVKVTAQFVTAKERGVLWSERYEEDFARISAVHERIAARVLGTMAPALAAQRRDARQGRHTESVEAYEAYIEGLFLWNRRTTVDVRQSVKYFRKAIQKDPDFALAHAGLAAACSMTWECWSEPEAAARKALALDPTLGEAHAVIGFVRMFHQMRLPEAKAEFERAIELSPNHASAHQWLALCLAAQGRLDEAKLRMRRALEIDPHSLVINADYGQVLFFAKEYEQAIERCRKTLALDPNFFFAHVYLYQIYTKLGMYGEAVDEYFHIHRLSFTDTAPIGPLRKAYESGGIRGFWQANTNGSLDAVMNLARYYTYLGDKDRALALLEKAAEYNDSFQFIFLKVDPAFEDLHPDPRFQELVRRISPHS